MLFLGLSLLWALFVWSLWEKVLTECTKSYLFDLRDSLRTWFLENDEYGLEHPSYRATREMLNATLWHVSEASYWQYLVFKMAVKRHPEWAKERRQYVDQKFFSHDKKVNDFIQSMRKDAAFAFGSYITLKSFTILFVFAIPGLCCRIFGIMVDVWNRIKSSVNIIFPHAPRLAKAFVLCFMVIAFPVRSPCKTSENEIVAWSLDAKMAHDQAKSHAKAYA